MCDRNFIVASATVERGHPALKGRAKLRRRSAAIGASAAAFHMLAILFLTGAALLGACLTRRVLRGTLEVWEQALWGTVAGWILAALAAYAAARASGRLTYATVAWATLFVWASAALLSAPWLARLRDAEGEGSARLGLSSWRQTLYGLRSRVGRRHVGLGVVL